MNTSDAKEVAKAIRPNTKLIHSEKQMKGGYSGLISFGLKAGFDVRNRFVDSLDVITSAYSRGTMKT